MLMNESHLLFKVCVIAYRLAELEEFHHCKLITYDGISLEGLQFR